jgi:hypothetical protein
MHRFLLVFLLFCSLALADGIPDVAANSALPLLGEKPTEGYFQQLSRIKAMESSRFMLGITTKNASRVVGCPTNRTQYHLSALPGASRGESQSDIFALARAGHRTFAITFEGKVNEPFSETVGDWLQTASDGKRERLAFICDLLGLTLSLPDHIHYQLLHRTASAVIEARRFKTDAAAMIVHSFSRERFRFGDFAQVASLFDTAKEVTVVDRLVAVRANARPPLCLGWACGDCRSLSA